MTKLPVLMLVCGTPDCIKLGMNMTKLSVLMLVCGTPDCIKLGMNMTKLSVLMLVCGTADCTRDEHDQTTCLDAGVWHSWLY